MPDFDRFNTGARVAPNELSRQIIGPTPSASVLIVGAGPGGLFAACELIRHGVKPRIVERRLAPHRETRGTLLQPAVMEMLDRAGLAQPFLCAGVHIRRLQLLGPGLQEIGSENFADAGCRYDFQCSQPQWRTEAILRGLSAGGRWIRTFSPAVNEGVDGARVRRFRKRIDPSIPVRRSGS